MNELSLFTGAGGGLLASIALGWRTIGYVEFEDYPQRIVAQRIKDGILEDAPIFGDIRSFISEGYAASYQGVAQIVSAGFPCQPHSVAGKRLSGDDSRDMWPATAEVIRIVRPDIAWLENVPGLLSSGTTATLIVIEKIRQLDLFGAGSQDTLAGKFIRGIESIVISRYIGRVFGDLAEMGYDAKWGVLGADDAGANHRRKRLWIYAWRNCSKMANAKC